MFLFLKHSQRQTWRGGTVYKLTALVETDPDELRIIQAHNFSEKLAYVVSLDHVHDLERRAEAAYQSQRKFSVFKQEDMGQIFWANTKVVALAIRANYARHTAFRVTVDDLIAGVVIEAPSLVEILDTETSIQKSFDALKRLVDHAATFEQDSETVFAPDDEDDDQLTPPSTWPRYSRR